MIKILKHSTSKKTLTYEKNGEIKTVEYDSINTDPYDLLTFTFHSILMMEMSLGDKSILDFSYECFSGKEHKFESYNEFTEMMLELDSLSDSEKDVLAQINIMEKTATWHLE